MIYRVGEFKPLGLAVVLAALFTAVGGLVISWAAGGQPAALSYDDRVRFMVEGEDVSLLRAEVFDLGGQRPDNSGLPMNKAL